MILFSPSCSDIMKIFEKVPFCGYKCKLTLTLAAFLKIITSQPVGWIAHKSVGWINHKSVGWIAHKSVGKSAHGPER
jgi:hypothetical protein